MRHLSSFVFVALACAASCAANAATLWNETSDGDFSNDGLTPTQLTLTAGLNTVLGTTGNSGNGVDRDYFSIVVPVGMQLTSIHVRPETNVSGGSSFFGLQIGPQLTAEPNGAGAEAMLGYTHYGNDVIGLDLLSLITPNPNLALFAGTYSVWVQETGGPASYGFDFEVQPVPLPGAALLLFSGLAGLGVLRRKS